MVYCDKSLPLNFIVVNKRGDAFMLAQVQRMSKRCHLNHNCAAQTKLIKLYSQLLVKIGTGSEFTGRQKQPASKHRPMNATARRPVSIMQRKRPELTSNPSALRAELLDQQRYRTTTSSPRWFVNAFA